MRHGFWWVAWTVIGLVSACSDDDASGGDCESVGERTCQLACDCKDGDGCGVIFDAEGNLRLTFQSSSECVEYTVDLVCASGGDPDVDYGACMTALDSAQCMGEGDESAVLSPPECQNGEE